MLSSRARLCHRCRKDLLSFFERGFCGPSVPRISPSPPQRLARFSKWQTRTLSISSRLRQKPPESENHEKSSRLPEGDRPLTEDELIDKFATFQQWEQFDGEDSIPDEVAEDETPKDESIETIATPPASPTTESILEDFQKQLTDLRTSDAAVDDIVRRARQTFGDILPEDLLSRDELQMYTRLYGEPLPSASEGDVEEPVLLDKGGEEVQYTMVRSAPQSPAEMEAIENWLEHEEENLETTDYADPNDMGDEALDETLQLAPGEDVPYEYQESSDERQHPMTTLGKFETRPRTLFLPREEYSIPVENVMSSFSNKQLKDVAERTFGGPGLPDSALTPRSGRSRPQVAVQLEASQHFMGEMEATAFMTTIMPPAFAAASSALTDARKRLGSTWLTELLSREGGPRVLDAGAGGAGIIAWNEIVRAHWESLHTSDTAPNPPPASRAVVLTGSNPLRHRASQLLENTTFVPRLPDYVHTRGRETMDDDRPAQQRKQFDVIISSYSLMPFKEEWERKQYVQNLWALLSPEGGILILIEKGIPRGFEAIAGARELLLERYIATPPGEDTQYTAQHAKSETEGAPWTPETGMIIGPCSNHERCPMYKIEGISLGRKDICSFQQRYIRPGHLQRILGASSRNHDDVDFSYLSVLKGRDLRRSSYTEWSHITDPLSAPSSNNTTDQPTPARNTTEWLDACQDGWHSSRPTIDNEPTDSETATEPTFAPAHALPRIVFPPMKRRGHAILDVCTPHGAIERWTVPRSVGKQAYRDARKARWGDLWALGAKTRRPRETRQGSGKDRLADHVLAGKLKGRGREAKMRSEVERLREREEMERSEERLEREVEEMRAGVVPDGYDDDGFGGSERFGFGPDMSRNNKKEKVPVRARNAKPGPGSADARYDLLANEEEEMREREMDEDELDWEIEEKLQVWEAELTDRRPTDKKGRVMKGGRRAKWAREAAEREGDGVQVEWRPSAGGGGEVGAGGV